MSYHDEIPVASKSYVQDIDGQAMAKLYVNGKGDGPQGWSVAGIARVFDVPESSVEWHLGRMGTCGVCRDVPHLKCSRQDWSPVYVKQILAG